MNVVPFSSPNASLRCWNAQELAALLSVYLTHAAHSDASAWEVGATELDDPQFFVLGPAPDLDCLVAVSRVGRVYVLENGSGRVLHEGPSLELLVARAKAVPERKSSSLLARITLSLAGVRLTIEERLGPILVETEEVVLRVAPQVVTLV